MIFGNRPAGAKRKQVRIPVSFQRLTAEIQTDATKDITHARIVLQDINTTGLGCFVTNTLRVGERVSFVIEEPQRIFLKGQVSWCVPVTTSPKIISVDKTFHYRAGIKFVFATKEEEQAMREFVESLYSHKKIA